MKTKINVEFFAYVIVVSRREKKKEKRKKDRKKSLKNFDKDFRFDSNQ